MPKTIQMEGVVYLKPKEEDLPRITAILEEARGNIRELKADDFLVAILGGKIIGCGRIRKLPGGALELSSVAILQEYRGRGIGSEIIRGLLKKVGDKPVYLECFGEKETFYRPFGFEIAAEDDLPLGFKEEFIFLKRLFADKGKTAIAMKRAVKA
jgi:N-acetylglutamate synthase-like GNAT family acetyltransferase